jgi:flagellar basal-body rod modification protein FlgD
MSTSPINGSGAANNQTAPPTTTQATDPLANQNVFLQLLVAQLKYQDPQNPADGTQFITQLAQFSELSNTTQMAADLAAIKVALTTPQNTQQTASQTTNS